MLDAISRTARVLAADDAGFPNGFRLPDGRSAQAVLTAARLCARDIETVAAQFIDHGMPETFVAECKGLLDDYATIAEFMRLEAGQSAQHERRRTGSTVRAR